MTDLERTLAAVQHHGWRVVLLRARDKRPAGRQWTITSDVQRIAQHHAAGGNLGLVCGQKSGVAVLDFDDNDAARHMVRELGPLRCWVRTGSGKGHAYVRWQPGLPAKIRWRGTVVGEVQRGSADGEGRRLQHVVMPPSIHPCGEPYTWLWDPRKPLPGLSHQWGRDFLLHDVEPAPRAACSEASGPHLERPADDPDLPDSWDGPPATEILNRARHQPGARRRADGGVKFQCAGCRDEGHDRHRDNARVFADGRWGCALDPRHKAQIAEQLGLSTVLAADAEGLKAPAALAEREDVDHAPLVRAEREDAPLLWEDEL